jgi:hypothetical protein
MYAPASHLSKRRHERDRCFFIELRFGGGGRRTGRVYLIHQARFAPGGIISVDDAFLRRSIKRAHGGTDRRFRRFDVAFGDELFRLRDGRTAEALHRAVADAVHLIGKNIFFR